MGFIFNSRGHIRSWAYLEENLLPVKSDRRAREKERATASERECRCARDRESVRNRAREETVNRTCKTERRIFLLKKRVIYFK